MKRARSSSPEKEPEIDNVNATVTPKSEPDATVKPALETAPEKVVLSSERSCLKVYKNAEITSSLDDCVKEIAGKLLLNPPVMVYGKIGKQHRSVGFFSDCSVGYKYSGQMMPSQALGSNLSQLLQKVNMLVKGDFNGILVNDYMTGSDYLGQHADDEKDLADVGVVAISYGATRKFRITDFTSGKIVRDVRFYKRQNCARC
jgi:alkylated DNA repair dioxygenase AlkB